MANSIQRNRKASSKMGKDAKISVDKPHLEGGNANEKSESFSSENEAEIVVENENNLRQDGDALLTSDLGDHQDNLHSNTMKDSGVEAVEDSDFLDSSSSESDEGGVKNIIDFIDEGKNDKSPLKDPNSEASSNKCNVDEDEVDTEERSSIEIG